MGFNNRRALIEEVNKGIRVMNVEADVIYLKLHMEGVRFMGGKKLHKHYPAKPIWREQEVRKKLHLTPEYKEKICVRAANRDRSIVPNRLILADTDTD